MKYYHHTLTPIPTYRNHIVSPNMNKRKIINDPVYGFFNIPYDIIFDIIEHPYFQRLRFIQQLGLTSLVYPGALHTRFHHTLGATHLMTQAIEVLRSKGVEITEEEAEAVTIAILLHDIGHGPFSHALEHSLVQDIDHETISILFMEKLNQHFNGKLSLAIRIFKGEYPKQFLHELVSSQLDMDRLDYLNRDSFFTGVHEGVIGSERLIKMLDVRNNHIVVEGKGILSVENFLVARRIMYWQVYLHKTVVCAEMMLVKILQRAKQLAQQNVTLFAPPALQLFLSNNFTFDDFIQNEDILHQFAQMGDMDIFTSIRVWQQHDDYVLSDLARRLVNRQLLKIQWSKQPIPEEKITILRKELAKQKQIDIADTQYLIFSDATSNRAYSYNGSQIYIAFKDGRIQEVTAASDYDNLSRLATPVVKYYYCYPREFEKIVTSL